MEAWLQDAMLLHFSTSRSPLWKNYLPSWTCDPSTLRSIGKHHRGTLILRPEMPSCSQLHEDLLRLLSIVSCIKSHPVHISYELPPGASHPWVQRGIETKPTSTSPCQDLTMEQALIMYDHQSKGARSVSKLLVVFLFSPSLEHLSKPHGPVTRQSCYHTRSMQPTRALSFRCPRPHTYCNVVIHESCAYIGGCFNVHLISVSMSRRNRQRANNLVSIIDIEMKVQVEDPLLAKVTAGRSTMGRHWTTVCCICASTSCNFVKMYVTL